MRLWHGGGRHTTVASTSPVKMYSVRNVLATCDAYLERTWIVSNIYGFDFMCQCLRESEHTLWRLLCAQDKHNELLICCKLFFIISNGAIGGVGKEGKKGSLCLWISLKPITFSAFVPCWSHFAASTIWCVCLCVCVFGVHVSLTLVLTHSQLTSVHVWVWCRWPRWVSNGRFLIPSI